jgi:hypothetical protein
MHPCMGLERIPTRGGILLSLLFAILLMCYVMKISPRLPTCFEIEGQKCAILFVMFVFSLEYAVALVHVLRWFQEACDGADDAMPMPGLRDAGQGRVHERVQCIPVYTDVGYLALLSTDSKRIVRRLTYATIA